MDVSSEYVKMCGKAEEIQQAWEPETPDFVVLRGCKEIEIVGKREFKEVRVLGDVWLPRQDQLQAMMGSDWIKTFDSFTWWVDSSYGTGVDEFYFEKCDDFTSMEQLWLTFVMKERYGKIWANGNWSKHG